MAHINYVISRQSMLNRVISENSLGIEKIDDRVPRDERGTIDVVDGNGLIDFFFIKFQTALPSVCFKTDLGH